MSRSPEGVGDRRADEAGVGDRGETDEGDAVSEGSGHVGRRRDREAGLADAAGTGQGDQADTVVAQEDTDRRQFPLAVDQRGQRLRQWRVPASRRPTGHNLDRPAALWAIGPVERWHGRHCLPRLLRQRTLAQWCRMAPPLSNEAVADGPDGGGGAGVDAELLRGCADVALDRPLPRATAPRRSRGRLRPSASSRSTSRSRRVSAAAGRRSLAAAGTVGGAGAATAASASATAASSGSADPAAQAAAKPASPSAACAAAAPALVLGAVDQGEPNPVRGAEGGGGAKQPGGGLGPARRRRAPPRPRAVERSLTGPPAPGRRPAPRRTAPPPARRRPAAPPPAPGCSSAPARAPPVPDRCEARQRLREALGGAGGVALIAAPGSRDRRWPRRCCVGRPALQRPSCSSNDGSGPARTGLGRVAPPPPELDEAAWPTTRRASATPRRSPSCSIAAASLLGQRRARRVVALRSTGLRPPRPAPWRARPASPAPAASARSSAAPLAQVAADTPELAAAPRPAGAPGPGRALVAQASAARRLGCSASRRSSHAHLLRPEQLRLGRLGQRQEVRGVAPPRRSPPRRSPPAAPARTRGPSPASGSAARRPGPSTGRSKLCSTSEATPSNVVEESRSRGVEEELRSSSRLPDCSTPRLVRPRPPPE